MRIIFTDSDWNSTIVECLKKKKWYCKIYPQNIDHIEEDIAKKYGTKKEWKVIIILCSGDVPDKKTWDFLDFLDQYENLVKIAITETEIKGLGKRFRLDQAFVMGKFKWHNLCSAIDTAYRKRNPKSPANDIYINADKINQIAENIKN